MEFLSLFAGIGGFDLGLERAGFRCIGQVEIDPFCARVLERRWPTTQRWADVRDFTGQWSGNRTASGNGKRTRLSCDLLTGGFPCQDLSIAGKRAGLGGERSGLFWEIVRIAKEVKPSWGLFENVPGLLSSHHGRDMWTVLNGLRECWPAVSYRILDSQHFGVAQRRRRVFFVCGPDEVSIAQILFEPESGERHPAASREAGAGVAHCLARGATGSHARYDPNGEDYIIAATIKQRGRGACDEVMDNLQIAVPITSTYSKGADRGGNDRGSLPEGHLVTHPLKAEDADASEDGTGRGVPMVPISQVNARSMTQQKDGHGIGNEGDPMFCLEASHQHGVGVRRLTPVECERLQGFPDGWTCLCQPLEAYRDDPENAALRCKCPDGPRCRALGNAVTVNVAEWIGKRLIKG